MAKSSSARVSSEFYSSFPNTIEKKGAVCMETLDPMEYSFMTFFISLGCSNHKEEITNSERGNPRPLHRSWYQYRLGEELPITTTSTLRNVPH